VTPRQIKLFLGLRPEHIGFDLKVRPEVVAGMAGVKDPETTQEALAAFKALMQCANIPVDSIFVPRYEMRLFLDKDT